MAKKLYEENDVINIAEALRLKNNGATTKYKLSEIENAVLNLPFANIPSYHKAEAGRVVRRLLELKALHPNSIIFGTISDNHINKANANVMTSARHAIYALETVGNIACDFVVNLGDNIAGRDGIDTEKDYADAVYMENISRFALTSQKGFSLIGNHDKSNSTEKLYNLIGKYNNFDVSGTTAIRGYGYNDFDDKKVRVIFLNTTDYWNAIGGNGMSYEQKEFLMNALDLSEKNNYSDWTIVILSHIPLDFLGGDYNKSADLKTILKAYMNGTEATINVNNSYANAQNESGKYSGTISKNYNGINAPKIINIHGHLHNNKYRNLKFIDDNTELSIVRVATPNSSFNGNESTNRYPDNGDYSITTEEANKIKKVANSKSDTSATFYFIDLDEQVIYSVGYGADIDRTIACNDFIVYSIKYNLTNAFTSNTSPSISKGEPYSSALSTETGYAIEEVTITMGGVDITSTAYSNGTITIGNVTGDIVISAKAVSETSYTNLLDGLAVKDNCRFNSGGAVSTSGTCNYWCVEDYIPCTKDDTIRAYLPNNSNLKTSSLMLFCAYDADKKFINSYYSNNTAGILTIDDDGLGWEFTAGTFTALQSMAYIRICGTPVGSHTGDEVLTKNEIIR